jgi:ABC-type lipoprotein export system ATPase subunit/ABC-type uncharacterized transport system permease subunit
MNEFVGILEFGFIDGIVWFPIVLAVGIIYKYLKVIDVSIDGITIMSAICFTFVYNQTASFFIAFGTTICISVICYLIVSVLTINFKINNILAGIIFTLILHSISVLFIGESIKLNYESLTYLNEFWIIILFISLLYLLIEYLLSTILGVKIKVVTDSLRFNGTISLNNATRIVYVISGVVLSFGVVIYTAQSGSARSGGGFEFLITALSSYLFVDKFINLFSAKLQRSTKYHLFQIIQSPVFKALLGSIFFQIIVNIIIFYTHNPIYWKLIFGIILLLLVSDFKIIPLKKKYKVLINDCLNITNVDFAYSDTFKKVEVFNNLSITFPTGLNFIWGSNGCGKSTLLKLIEGSLSPEKGYITYKKLNLTTLPKNKRNLFFIPQQPYQSLSSSSTVAENIIASKTFKNFKIFKLAKTQKPFEDCKVEVTQWAGNLSGGQAQWLNLELCKISNKDIILADEPTSGLDLSNFNLFLEFVQQQSLSGKTIIIVTHDTRFKNIEANHINLKS